MDEDQLFVERRPQGDYAVRRPNSERASAVLPTQRPFGKRAVWDSHGARRVIQALYVDQAEPWPDGRDRQEDEALPL
jgi:hypothetical protein